MAGSFMDCVFLLVANRNYCNDYFESLLEGMETDLYIRELINRLARLDAASGWDGDLNPTQRAVLAYLGRANRFSRSPSHVAEYLGTTRGTISQSFKSLQQKGYVSELRSSRDKRTISFALTPKGEGIAQTVSNLDHSLSELSDSKKQALQATLTEVLRRFVQQNDGRAFGVCKTCIHYKASSSGGFCTLLSEPLSPEDSSLICHEQQSA
ncbi:MarR family winged helix-turn-helix transcriptional regulator [Meridianimarinicoccus sp. MJW13]|uniref:MarR family winged helix-turn-helix transcriptional regulator n=1 Tax=Meridianimarinicoccus sp. MJW13 TaxID=2720031 RepID=UPI001D004DD9|nr:MarR family transcriptional regulator [Fluviibacterium sp. MJW13]